MVNELLRRSDIYPALQKIVASGRFANEVDALVHAVRTLQYAIGVKSETQAQN